MWVPREVADWFSISKDSVAGLREELAAVKAERDVLKQQLTVANTNFDWARVKLNQLEYEKAALFEKLTGAKIPAPEMIRASRVSQQSPFDQVMSFEDIGDQAAKKLGFELHDLRPLPGEGN